MEIEEILKKIKNRTIINKLESKVFGVFIQNENTKNKFIRDRALKKLKRRYNSFLDKTLESKKEIMPPMEYSNYVWMFWRQGYDKAPKIVKACYKSLKENLKDRNVIFLSETNMQDYVTVPEYIQQKHKKGIIFEAQYSDIIRICLLAKHGGMWIDSTVFCTGNHLADLMKQWPLFFFKMEDTDRTEMALICSNWLISTYTNNLFIECLKDMMLEYWRRENKMVNYFVFHLFVHMVKDKLLEVWDAIPTYNNISPHILQFEMLNQYEADRFDEIRRFSDFHKLYRVSENETIQGTYYQKIIQDAFEMI